MELKKSEVIKGKEHKLTNTECDQLDEKCTWPWKMKEFANTVTHTLLNGKSDTTENFITLTALYKGGIYFPGASFVVGHSVIKNCFAVHYMLGDSGTTKFYDNEDEAIAKTLKLIELAKA